MARAKSLKRFVASVAVLLVLPGAQALSVARQRSGLVLGRVVDATTGQPIADARVTMARPDVQLTDNNGQFVYFDVPGGDHTLLVSKPGYGSSYYGQRWVDPSQDLDQLFAYGGAGIRLSLGKGERRSDVTLRLWKVATISGRVVDEAGDAVVGVRVCAYPRAFAGGRPWLNTAVPSESTTDDRGVYRIPELAPGDYIVGVPFVSLSAETFGDDAALRALPPEARALRWNGGTASLRSASVKVSAWSTAVPGGASPAPEVGVLGRRAYPTTFAPSAVTASSAGVISVAAGENRAGIDIAISPVPTRMLSGSLVGPNGPVANVGVRLYRADDPMGGLDVGVSVSDSTGRFAFPSVPSGAYRLGAQFTPTRGQLWGMQTRFGTGSVALMDADPLSASPTLWADIAVAIGDVDRDDVVIAMRAGARIRGVVRLEADGKPAPPDFKGVRLQLERGDGRIHELMFEEEIAVDAGGQFQSVGLPAGRYFIRTMLSRTIIKPEWQVASAMWRGRDISLDAAKVGAENIDDVVVTLTRKPASVQGTVTSDTPMDVAVVMFTTDEARWVDYGRRPRDLVVALPDSKGAFSFPAVPSGKCVIAAIPAAAMPQWPNPELLRKIAGSAQRIDVAAGQPTTVEVRPIVVRVP